GSGFINDFINNLPFELHVPGYQFLGPGTKINKRIKRGEPGINPLDQAAREHDIYYRDHTNVEERNKADEILEDKAIDRIFSKDASFDERLIAIPTALTIDLKRRFGMGMRVIPLFLCINE
ncbi:hypothetical protein, partial [Klebsiella pneumoniae]|uniref:hypothetical protein n=1 Tax=Klebsiella pneumoniae TaxID=573 RepID=UPI00163DC7BE